MHWPLQGQLQPPVGAFEGPCTRTIFIPVPHFRLPEAGQTTAGRSCAADAAWMRTISISVRLAIRVGDAAFVVRPAARQSVRRPLRRLMAYGSTNKYRPVKRSKASGSSGE